MRHVEVVRTYLELSTPEALRAAPATEPRLTVELESPCAVATYRALYDAVGRAYHWQDRLAWSDELLAQYLVRDDVRVWIARLGGELAGYFELVCHADASVEIAYFGLTGRFMGRGLGKELLTRAVEEAWSAGATRVWLHTCTLDAPAALPNYLARGFTPVRTERYVAELPDDTES